VPLVPRARSVVPAALALLLAALALGLLSGCGGSGSSSSGETAADTGATEEATTPGEVEVVWEEPETEADAIGREMLEASETEALAASLAEAFELPNPLLVRGVAGSGGGPFYSPEDNSITLPYEFAALVLEVVESTYPESSPEEIGEKIGAINSFIFAHEFAHALIANLNLPVLGKEEDAADSIATYVLLNADEGAAYAADAAFFWAAFSERQSPPALVEYADSHSLDLQRSFAVLCWVAGSSEQSFEEVAELELLPPERLEACPAEYEQLVESLGQELRPHLSPEGEEAAEEDEEA
jgi:Putative metallopeptidase